MPQTAPSVASATLELPSTCGDQTPAHPSARQKARHRVLLGSVRGSSALLRPDDATTMSGVGVAGSDSPAVHSGLIVSTSSR